MKTRAKALAEAGRWATPTIGTPGFVAEVMTEFLAQRWEALDACFEEPLFRTRIPLALTSKANSRGHTRWAAKTNKAQRDAGVLIGKALRLAWRNGGHGVSAVRVIRLVRVAPRLLDSDNAEVCMKCVRDGVADALGIDDRDPRVRYVVDQAKGPAAVEAYLYARRSE